MKKKSQIDITIGDLTVCPIDDHMTMGMQFTMMYVTTASLSSMSKPVMLINNMMLDPSWMIL